MDYAMVEARFGRLKAQYDRGALTEPRFKAQLEDLMIEDEQGRWWTMGHETGQWYVHDGQKWVQKEPPRATLSTSPGYAPYQGAAALQSDSRARPLPTAYIEMAAVNQMASPRERQFAPAPVAAPIDSARQGALKAATSALWLAIVGLFVCSVILAPVAIVQARKARKVLGPGDPGYGKALAAEIISWVGLGVWILGVGLSLLSY